MAKSARRRTAKKTVGKKKSGTKRYRQRTMRIRRKGGGGLDSDSDSGNESPQLRRKTLPSPSPPPPSQMKSVQYNIFERDKKWFVTIIIGAEQTTYAVPKDILDSVRPVQITELG
jgi:hypothetical protein